MADRIKGITIEIDGNTTKLSKALEGVNKDIKNTQTSLKDVEKLLQLDPGNIELLRQKDQLLNDAFKETQEKLSVLKNALNDMDAKGVDKTSDEYQRLQREIIATESELKKAQKASSEFNATLEKMSQSLGKFSEGANKVANSTKGISSAAGLVAGKLVSMGIEAGRNADDLNTLAKQTGLSTDELQKFSYASDLIDVSLDTMTGSLKKLKKSMVSNSEDTAEAWERIGVSITDSNGELRDISDVFYDVLEGLSGIENETERDTVAMQLFGKSADELAGIIDDGGAALKELSAEAESRGVIISQEDLDKANDLNDILDRLKATLSGSVGQAAAKLAEALTPALEKIAEVITKIADIIANMSPEMLNTILVITGIIAAISPIASIIGGIASVLQVVIPILTAVNAVIAANPIVLIIMAIIAAIALLVAAGVAIYKNWDTIKDKVTELWGVVVDKFNAIKDAVVEKFNAIKDFFGNIMGGLKDVAKEKLGNIKKAFEENGGGIKGAAAAAWQGLKEYWTAGFDVIDKLTGGKLTEIKEMFFGKFRDIIDSAKTWGKDLIDNLVHGIRSKIDAVRDAVGNIAQTIRDFIGFSEPKKGPLSKFHTFMPDMIELMTEGIEDGVKSLAGPMSTLASGLIPQTAMQKAYDDSAVTSRLDQLNGTIANGNNTNVTVVLQGDAQGLFKMVRQENQKFTKSTGYNPLAAR